MKTIPALWPGIVFMIWLVLGCGSTQTPGATQGAGATTPRADSSSGATQDVSSITISPAQTDAGVGGFAVASQLASLPSFGSAVSACVARSNCQAIEDLMAIDRDASVDIAAIRAALQPATDAVTRGETAPPRAATDPSSLATSLDALALSTFSADVLLQGLANFLMNRVEREVRATVLNRVRIEVCTGTPFASALLVNTCGYLGGTESESSFQADFGSGLRQALERDVIDLPQHLSAYFSRPGNQAPPRLARLLRVTSLILQRSSPTRVVDGLVDELPQDTEINREAARAMRFLTLAVQQISLQNNTLDPAARDEVVYLLARASLCDGDPCRRALERRRAQLHEVAAAVSRVVTAAEVMNDPSQSASARRERIAVFASSLAVAIDGVVRVGIAIQHNEAVTVPPELDALLRALERVSPLFEALSSGEAGRIVGAVLGEVRQMLPQPCFGSETDCGKVLRVIEMGAELASARTEQDVQRVLEGFALPPGAYRIQRANRTFAISSIGGIGAGAIWQSGRVGEFQGNLVLSLGIDMTWPVRPSRTCGDLGIHLSLLDLGAYASVNSSGSDKVSWERFVTPGLWVRYGFHDLPLAVAIGANASPLEDGRPLRVLAFVGVDLPIFLLGN